MNSNGSYENRFYNEKREVLRWLVKSCRMMIMHFVIEESSQPASVESMP
jgi:hypothetical protein